MVAILLASTSTILSSPTSPTDITSLLYDTDTDVVGEEDGQEEDEEDTYLLLPQARYHMLTLTLSPHQEEEAGPGEGEEEQGEDTQAAHQAMPEVRGGWGGSLHHTAPWYYTYF